MSTTLHAALCPTVERNILENYVKIGPQDTFSVKAVLEEFLRHTAELPPHSFRIAGSSVRNIFLQDAFKAGDIDAKMIVLVEKDTDKSAIFDKVRRAWQRALANLTHARPDSPLFTLGVKRNLE